MVVVIALITILGLLASSLCFVNLENARDLGRQSYELARHSVAWRGICICALIVALIALQIYAWANGGLR